MVSFLLRNVNFVKAKSLYKSESFNIRRVNTKTSSLDYCLNLVNKCDYENFLCTLLLPNHLISAGIALRAFNVEIAKVQDHVSENVIGLMRFQFWDDTIDKMFAGKIPEHPVCIELSKVIGNSNLSKLYLKRLIDARRNQLSSFRFSSMKKVEEYADLANSPIYLLLLELADIKKVDADHAASHLGRAQGIANLLRSTMYNSQKNIVSIPEDMLVKYKVSEEDILRNKMDTNIKDMFFDIATEAHLHIESVEKIQKDLDKACRRILLPSVAVKSYLKRLESVDFNVYHPKLQRKNELLSLRLYWRKLFL
ncbi:NADH dehydrogenase (ubiquinone) complex I, assembly factor 6 [Planococcus citri]|uniref:NADH dehydrogenase (ubiquinone) complex I, assembly factor 6 n=1 Tax=Planococcus citri TaxID=170843 RepID=UPI0031F95AD7